MEISCSLLPADSAAKAGMMNHLRMAALASVHKK